MSPPLINTFWRKSRRVIQHLPLTEIRLPLIDLIRFMGYSLDQKKSLTENICRIFLRRNLLP
jgi:hypothetical protein